MIQRVYEQCKKSESLSDVIVATDDERIEKHVRSFGGKVVMTATSHQSGTDRCAEVVHKYDGLCDAVINIQGDEPFIDPTQIDALAFVFNELHTQIATLIKPLKDEADIKNPNIVKVTKNKDHRAIYFSRSPIPYRRNPEATITYYKHIGIYGYRKEVLAEITQLPLEALNRPKTLSNSGG
jgi:3-deoxy-manno-octulosonate cytidylyltransferase (CMP-KDO synthetase)